MASDDDSEDLTGGTHEPRECMACRGTGSVISNLGGSPSTVDCPWCAGSGIRSAEADAQARWGEGTDASAQGESADRSAEPAEQSAG